MHKLNYATDEKSKEDFKKWFLTSDDSFLIRHKSSFLFNSFDDWIRRCDYAHEDVREILGGEIIHTDVEIEKSQDPVDWEQYPDIRDELSESLIGFLNHYSYDMSFLSMPTYQKDSHNVLKVSKVVNNFYMNNSDRNKITEVQKLMSKVGDIWAKHRRNNRKGCLTISTNPKGFVLLGHYAPDNDSCFRQGSTSIKDKFVLAQTLNTIVITLSEYKDKKKKHVNIARSFGFLDPDNKNIHLTNCYAEKGLQEGDIISLYQDGFEKILNKKFIYTEGKISFSKDRDKVYPNGFGRWSFVGNKRDTFSQPTTNLWGLYDNTCPETGIYSESDSDWNFIDSKWCHPEAQEFAKQCLISGKYSFNPMKSIKDLDGCAGYVLDRYYDDIPVCEETGEKCIRLETTPDGKNIASYLFNERYEECEATGQMYPVEDIVDLLGYSVSKESIKKGIFPFDEDEINQIAMVHNSIAGRNLVNA